MTPFSPSNDEALERRIEAELGPLVETVAPQRVLWHYAKFEVLESILEHKQIWATDSRHLNDSQELTLGEEDIYAVVESMRQLERGGRFKGIRAGLWDRYSFYRTWAAPTIRLFTVAVASFSEADDDLSQWRAYGVGPRGCGVSIGIRFPDDDSWFHTTGAILVPCDYEEDAFRQRVKGGFQAVERLHGALLDEHVFSPDDILNALLLRSHRTAALLCARRKHHGFRAEKEWRVITIEADDERIEHRADGTPYVRIDLPRAEDRLSLEAVGVGPSPDLTTRLADIRQRLTARGYGEATDVLPSDIPFIPTVVPV